MAVAIWRDEPHWELSKLLEERTGDPDEDMRGFARLGDVRVWMPLC